MRHVLQILRDIAELECEEAIERNDRDSADCWESIAAVCDKANRDIASVWRIIQERNPGIEGNALRRASANLHAASKTPEYQ